MGSKRKATSIPVLIFLLYLWNNLFSKCTKHSKQLHFLLADTATHMSGGKFCVKFCVHNTWMVPLWKKYKLICLRTKFERRKHMKTYISKTPYAPDPVCPYAISVPLNPLIAASTKGGVIMSQTWQNVINIFPWSTN